MLCKDVVFTRVIEFNKPIATMTSCSGPALAFVKRDLIILVSTLTNFLYKISNLLNLKYRYHKLLLDAKYAG